MNANDLDNLRIDQFVENFSTVFKVDTEDKPWNLVSTFEDRIVQLSVHKRFIDPTAVIQPEVVTKGPV